MKKEDIFALYNYQGKVINLKDISNSSASSIEGYVYFIGLNYAHQKNSFTEKEATVPIGISIAYLLVHEIDGEKKYELKIQRIKDSELKSMQFYDDKSTPNIGYKVSTLDILENTNPDSNGVYKILADKLMKIPAVMRKAR